MKKCLLVTRYARYVDDFIILDEDSQKLNSIADDISTFCKEKLDLNICASKTILQKSTQGIDFWDI